MSNAQVICLNRYRNTWVCNVRIVSVASYYLQRFIFPLERSTSRAKFSGHNNNNNKWTLPHSLSVVQHVCPPYRFK
jgi:hypothetical protein